MPDANGANKKSLAAAFQRTIELLKKIRKNFSFVCKALYDDGLESNLYQACLW